MDETMSELNSLDKRIDFFLNTYHKVKDENDELIEKVLSFDKELLSRDEKINFLTLELKKKDFELQELVNKLNKILD